MKWKSFSYLSVSLIFLTFAVALSSCGPSPQELEKAIGDYLQKNPQVIQKAVQNAPRPPRPPRPPEPPLEERIKNAIQVPLNNAPTIGAANAPITIVEFSDFQCPFCSRVIPTVKQVLKDYDGKVRIAFRQNPLSFHNNAMSAAKASLAAHEQGKFWEMHDALFANQKDLSEANILKLAQDLKLNVKKFEADWKSNKYDAQIQQDIQFAQANKASGTPAFFINGVLLSGAQPITSFKAVIDKVLEMKK